MNLNDLKEPITRLESFVAGEGGDESTGFKRPITRLEKFISEYGGGSSLPDFTSEDIGKVLMIDTKTEYAVIVPEQTVTIAQWSTVLSDADSSAFVAGTDAIMSINGNEYTGTMVDADGAIGIEVVVNEIYGQSAFMFVSDGAVLFASDEGPGEYTVSLKTATVKKTVETVTIVQEQSLTADSRGEATLASGTYDFDLVAVGDVCIVTVDGTDYSVTVEDSNNIKVLDVTPVLLHIDSQGLFYSSGTIKTCTVKVTADVATPVAVPQWRETSGMVVQLSQTLASGIEGAVTYAVEAFAGGETGPIDSEFGSNKFEDSDIVAITNAAEAAASGKSVMVQMGGMGFSVTSTLPDDIIIGTIPFSLSSSGGNSYILRVTIVLRASAEAFIVSEWLNPGIT